MRQFLFVLATIFTLSLCSCQKFEMDYPQDDVVEITLTTSVVNGYIPTRGFDDEILNSLPYVYPTTITFYGSGGKYVLDLTKGNTISLQKGEYYVQAFSGNISEENILSQKCVPLVSGFGNVRSGTYGDISLSTTMQITESKTYNLELYIAGFIVACDKHEVSYFKWEQVCDSSQKGKMLKDTDRFETENYYYYILSMSKTCLLAAQTRYTEFGVELGATEKNEKTYKSMRATRGGDYNVVGKYYLFNPNENCFREFSFSVGAWENGGER